MLGITPPKDTMMYFFLLPSLVSAFYTTKQLAKVGLEYALYYIFVYFTEICNCVLLLSTHL